MSLNVVFSSIVAHCKGVKEMSHSHMFLSYSVTCHSYIANYMSHEQIIFDNVTC